jgi:uncharacterized protein YjbJ (UPF0337 family)
MANDIVNGKWKQVKGKVREGWGVFTQDHHHQAIGKRDQFLGQLQEQYGHAKGILGQRLPKVK